MWIQINALEHQDGAHNSFSFDDDHQVIIAHLKETKNEFKH